jgi:hypothetical protein
VCGPPDRLGAGGPVVGQAISERSTYCMMPPWR